MESHAGGGNGKCDGEVMEVVNVKFNCAQATTLTPAGLRWFELSQCREKGVEKRSKGGKK